MTVLPFNSTVQPLHDMKSLLFASLLALPLAVRAQTPTPTPAPQQVSETTEELDPNTGKVVRRTTRTYTVPAGTVTPRQPTIVGPNPDLTETSATDAQVAAYLAVPGFALAKLSAPALLDTYGGFMSKVRTERRTWKPADWAQAAAVLRALNTRYEALRETIPFDDKLTIRSEQAEFQALRTARQITEQVINKL